MGEIRGIADRLARRAAHLRELELLQERELGPYLPSYIPYERLRRALGLKEALLEEFAGTRLEELYRCGEVESEFGKVLRLEDSVGQELSLPDRHRSFALLSSQLRLLYGIGPVSERELRERGYRTLRDLVTHPRFGPAASQLLLTIQRGDLPKLKTEVERWFSPSHPLTLALTGLAEGRLIFFDLESLGLFGRPLVLLGLARPVDGGLLIEQYVIRSIGEEQAALAAAVEALTQAEAIVTYNGRAFDINYLEERLSYYGLYRPVERPNFDLLYHARRRFKGSLPDCRLETVERYVLGIERPFDLPSALVPDFYNTYLEERNIGPLVAIIEHNKQDLVSLAALLSRLCSESERW
ncbi:TPA: exonuclease [Candidatus Bipolaricaulota bacterium]|nr:exonuclease [Candidatus Bipolaricaulota bacterium]